MVALYAEGVDRNMACTTVHTLLPQSPSTRRAWIEIFGSLDGADRKRSPSTRRAWIEIRYRSPCYKSYGYVALHAEGVDRNIRSGDIYGNCW